MEELERCLAGLEGSAPSDLLAQVRSAVSTVRQELEVQTDIAAARLKSGQDWQTLKSEREAEVVRLRAEINRMRQALSSSTQAHSSQADEVASLQKQLQQALALNKAHERQAVVTTAASEGPSAELHRLRAELEGRTAQLQQAEMELATQTAGAASRLKEMQDSFVAKIADMRRTHQQQLEQAVAAARAAAASEAAAVRQTGPRAGAAALEQQNAQRLLKAEAEVVMLREKVTTAESAAGDLQVKLDQARADADAVRSQLSAIQFGEKALKVRVKELEGQLAKAQQQLEQLKKQQVERGSPPEPPAAPKAPAPVAAAPAVDLGMVAMMEGQLGRLSEIIRTRETEVVQMRAALQTVLEERRELMAQLETLQAALAMAQQALAQQHGGGVGGGSISGAGGGGSSGLGSPKSSTGTPARGAAHVSPGRPYRVGLTSKPKFFK